jgi:hypothetical protein
MRYRRSSARLGRRTEPDYARRERIGTGMGRAVGREAVLRTR